MKVVRRDDEKGLYVVLTQVIMSIPTVALLDLVITAEKFMSFLGDVNPTGKLQL